MPAAPQSIERFDAVAKTTPAAAALRIIVGIEKNQPRILIGNDARFMDLLQRFRPATYWAVLARKIEKMAAKAGKLGRRAAATRVVPLARSAAIGGRPYSWQSLLREVPNAGDLALRRGVSVPRSAGRR